MTKALLETEPVTEPGNFICKDIGHEDCEAVSDKDQVVMQLDNLLELMEEFDARVAPGMVHVRIWQFALSAGLMPREIADVIHHLVDSPEENTSLVEAVTAWAIWGNRPSLNTAEHFVGSVTFNAFRALVATLMKEGFSPEETADAVRHDFEVASGEHECSEVYIDKLREAKEECEK